MEVKFCPYCGRPGFEKKGNHTYECKMCGVIVYIQIEATTT